MNAPTDTTAWPHVAEVQPDRHLREPFGGANVPREVARQLNPLIGFIDARETMANVASVTTALGYAISDCKDVGGLIEHCFLLTNMVAAALRYEATTGRH